MAKADLDLHRHRPGSGGLSHLCCLDIDPLAHEGVDGTARQTDAVRTGASVVHRFSFRRNP